MVNNNYDIYNIDAKKFSYKKGLIIIIPIVLIVIFLLTVSGVFLHYDSPKRCVKGGCPYDKFYGKCKITSIVKYSEVYPDSTLYRDEYVVKFKFTLSKILNLLKSKAPIDKFNRSVYMEHYFYRGSGINLPEWYLEKYGFKEGEIFPCDVCIIKGGTCSPVIFDFRNIDEFDYGEEFEKRIEEYYKSHPDERP